MDLISFFVILITNIIASLSLYIFYCIYSYTSYKFKYKYDVNEYDVNEYDVNEYNIKNKYNGWI